MTRANVGIPPASGKWYWEYYIATIGAFTPGIANAATSRDVDYVGESSRSYGLFLSGGEFAYTNGVGKNLVGPTVAIGDTVMIAYDSNSSKFFGGCNGVWYNNGDPSSGFNELYTVAIDTYFPAVGGGVAGACAGSVNFGQTAFRYAPPTGFNVNRLTLCSSLLPRSKSVAIKTWGAGGRQGQRVIGSSNYMGGFGAFAFAGQGSFLAGQVLKIVVGQTGVFNTEVALTLTTGNGGSPGPNDQCAGGGGGFSGVFLGSVTFANVIVVAAAGGGGASDPATGGNGGTIGTQGSSGRSGFGASQNAGGAAGNGVYANGNPGGELIGGQGGALPPHPLLGYSTPTPPSLVLYPNPNLNPNPYPHPI